MDNADDSLLERVSLYGVFTPAESTESARCARLIVDGYLLKIPLHRHDVLGQSLFRVMLSEKAREHLATLRRVAKIRAAATGNGGPT